MAASLKPFSIAGIKTDGIACPTIMFSNSKLAGEPAGSGSTYLKNRNQVIPYFPTVKDMASKWVQGILDKYAKELRKG